MAANQAKAAGGAKRKAPAAPAKTVLPETPAASADWKEIKREVELGFDPISAIALRFGVAWRSISAMKRLHGWRRISLAGAAANINEEELDHMTRRIIRTLNAELRAIERRLSAEAKAAKGGAEARDEKQVAFTERDTRSLTHITRMLEKLTHMVRGAQGKAEAAQSHEAKDPHAELERRLSELSGAGDAQGVSGEPQPR